MAKIEAEIVADITPFQRALAQATARARAFAKEMAGISADIGKEGLGGNLSKVMGFAGAAGSAVALGAAVTETAKDAVSAFAHMETSALSYGKVFKTNGMDVAEWIDSVAGARGSADDLGAALLSLGESGLGLDVSKEKLLQLSEMAVGGKENVATLGEAIRKATAGGLDQGDGASKLLKGFKNLQAMIQPEINKQAETFRKAHTRLLSYDEQGANGGKQWGMSSADSAEYNKMKGMDAHEFVQNKGLTADKLWELVGKATGAGGQFNGSVAGAKGTLGGKGADAAQAWEDQLEEMGKSISTGLKPALDELIVEMPKLKPAMKALGEAVGGAITSITHSLEFFTGNKTAKQMREADPLDAGNKSPLTAQLEDAGQQLDKLAFGNIMAMAQGRWKDVKNITDVIPARDTRTDGDKRLDQTNAHLEAINKKFDLMYSGT